MRLSKNKIIYCIVTIVLVALVYMACCKCYYGKLYFLYGNSNRHVWEMEDMQKVAKDFEINEEGVFVSTSPDSWFSVEESFPVRTIVVDVDYIEDKRNSQVFYYSNNQELAEEASYYFKLHKGLNYLQIPEGQFNKFRLDLTDSSDINLKINSITTYGSRVMPALLFVIVIGISLIVSRIGYVILFNKKKNNNMDISTMNAEKVHKEEKSMSRISTKYKIYLYIANLGIIISTYLVYIANRHHSIDSYEAFLDIGALARTNLRNGRFIHYLIYFLLDKLSINILEQQMFVQLLLSVVIAIGITMITLRFVKLFDNAGIKILSIVDLSVIFIFLSPCFLLGWYSWPETLIGSSLSLVVLFGAIHFWCKEELGWKDIFYSFILAVVVIGMYQVYVEIYVGICLTYSLLKYKFKCNKSSLKEYVIMLCSGGSASIINIVFMTLIQNAGIVYKDERSASTSLETIIDNFLFVLGEQPKIWDSMMGYLPKHFLPICIFVVLVIAFLGIVRNNKNNEKDYIFLLINMATVYTLAFVPNIISGTVWLAPRTYIGLYVFFFLIFIWTLYCIVENAKLVTQYLYILGIITLISCLRDVQIQVNTVVSNQFDKFEVDTIVRKIKQYESDTGIHVDNIAYTFDSSRRYDYDNVKYVAYDTNTRVLAYSWAAENMLRYYYDKNVNIYTMTEEEYIQRFSSQEWDCFEPEQQLQFENATLYWVIY